MADSKYARYEFERRWLRDGVPADVHSPVRITDRYLHRSRLRLRRIEPVDGPPTLKFGQKIRPDPADPSIVLLTNLYLDEGEYALLAGLPADELVKTRYRWPAGGSNMHVDVYEDPHAGLVLAEASFADREAMLAFELPDGVGVGAEVTADDRYSGGGLARASTRPSPRIAGDP